MPAHAIVVLCPKRPDLFGQPVLGHVAWGFELPTHEWVIGAVEGDGWKHGNGVNGFWSRKVPSLNHALQHFAHMQYQDAEYNYVKILRVTDNVFPDPDGALHVMKWVSGQKYELFGRNCMNSAYDILRAFSRGGNFNGKILPTPDLNWIPNGWYNEIKVPDSDFRYLPTPTESVHAFGTSNDAADDVMADMAATCPDWRNADSDDFLAIDASATEAADKAAVNVAEPTAETTD